MKNSPKLKRTFNKLKVVKRTIKFLSVAIESEVLKAVIKQAPDAVIRAISTAAVNACQGALPISPHLRPLFRRHDRQFVWLIDQRRSLTSSPRLILQQGGALPIIDQSWQLFLAQLAANLFRGFYTKMTNSFTKKILIELAEFDLFNNGSSVVIHLNYKRWLACKTKLKI